MWRLIAQRLAAGGITLFVVSVIVFTITEILPGDVAQAILGQSATPETLEALRRSLNLDEPAALRYWNWLSSALRGDLGVSLANGLPIAEQLGHRLRNTLFLAAIAACFAVPIALFLGITSAILQGSIYDRMVNILSLAAVSLPEFFVGYVLIRFLAVQLGLFPSIALVSSEMELGTRLYVVVLPAATLTIIALAHMMRMTRAAIVGVMSLPYIEMAILKGISPWRVVVQHALPNALAPIITVVGFNLAYLIVGVIVVEVVFVYPGIGQLMVDAVAKRDIPVVQACALIFALTYVGLNLVADLMALAANPRLRTSR